MGETWKKQYNAWLDDVADQPKSQIRDGVIVGILTDAFNDSAITMAEYAYLVLHHANKFYNINAIASPHGELIRIIAEKSLTKAKKKGLF